MTSGGLTKKHLSLHGINSVDEWTLKAEERIKARDAFERIVLDPLTPGLLKTQVRCDYILQYGKTLFSCPMCWLLPGVCICKRLSKIKLDRAHVVISVHNLEWGKASNSGAIAALSVEGGEVLLRGQKDHDARLDAILNDPNSTVAVLFPGEQAVSPQELKQIADEKTGGAITILAVDATWRNAVRLKQSYPKGLLQVKLTSDSPIISEQVESSSKSLLYPVRKYAGEESLGRVSTLEAVASLLIELEAPERAQDIKDVLLGNLKEKVNACCAQKSLPPPYSSPAYATENGGDISGD